MDRIEQLMKDAKPRVGAPGVAPGSDSARSIVFSTDPNVVQLAGRTPAGGHRHDAKPSGPRRQPCWPLRLSLPQWLSAGT